MISSHERRVWHDIERQPVAVIDLRVPPGTHERGQRRHGVRSADDVPVPLAMGIWAGITLVLLGAVAAGVVVLGVAVLLVVLWRYRPLLGGTPATRPGPGPARPRGGGA